MKRKKNIIKKIVYIGVLLVIIYIIFNYAMRSYIHSRKEVIVPNIENKSVVEALGIVSNLGLGLKKIGETYNSDLPAGTIVSQQPPAGMVVREGRFINVVLSLGGQKVFVPNIVGKEKREAEIILRQYGLSVGTVTETFSLRYAKNFVISQQPQEGEIVERNTQVNYTLSLGFPPENLLLVPEFKNKPLEEAFSWAQQKGIEVVLKDVYSKDHNDGIVIDQFPLPDSVISQQEKLELVVARSLTQPKNMLSQQPEYNFVYELPAMGGKHKNVKIVQVTPTGERVLYNQLTPPGEKIFLYISDREKTKIRVFIDGVLIDEK